MKTFLKSSVLGLSLLFLIVSLNTKAQLMKEKSYTYSANIVKLSDGVYKYFLMDVPANQCRLYNGDHSLYKTIALSVPSGMFLYDVKYISTNLFNTDAQIELVYTYYEYIVVNATLGTGYYKYYTKVVSETGTVLLNSPGVLYAYLKKISDTGTYKLFMYGYDYSTTVYTVWTDIYSIPGIPISITEALAIDPIGDIFPNPASDFATLKYSVDLEAKDAKLVVTNMQGSKISSYSIVPGTDQITIPLKDYASGNYLYHIQSANTRTEVGKLVVK